MSNPGDGLFFYQSGSCRPKKAKLSGANCKSIKTNIRPRFTIKTSTWIKLPLIIVIRFFTKIWSLKWIPSCIILLWTILVRLFFLYFGIFLMIANKEFLELNLKEIFRILNFDPSKNSIFLVETPSKNKL